VDADADDLTGDSATGRLTLGAGEDLNLYHGGTNSYIVNDTGDLIIDSADDIELDFAGGNLKLTKAGTGFGKIAESSGDLVVEVMTQDKDITFVGDDGGSEITALTIDMSDDGNAIFKSKATVGVGATSDTMLVYDGNAADWRIGVDDSEDLLEFGAGTTHATTAAFAINSSGQVCKERRAIGMPLKSGTNSYSILVTDSIILVGDTSSNAKTATLPAATADMDGQTWTITDTDNASTNNITINLADSSDYMQGSAGGTYVMNAQHESVTIVCRWVTSGPHANNGKYYVIGGYKE
jgi:hypothetical protein